MKINKRHIKLILTSLMIIFVLSSCATQSRTAMKPKKKKKCKCPTFSYMESKRITPQNCYLISYQNNLI